MKIKFIASTIIVTLLATISVPNIANAAVYQESNKITVLDKSETMPVESAIKIIETKYLIKNSDGTMTIADKAKNEIPDNILNDLKVGLQNTNNNIINGNLTVSKAKKDFKVDINKNGDLINNGNILAKSSSLLDNHAYKYSWFWWGFAAWIDKSGTDILINDLEFLRNILILEGTAAGFLSCGVGLAAALVTAGGCESLIRQAKNAKVKTKSCIAYCYGSPSASQVYKITSSW